MLNTTTSKTIVFSCLLLVFYKVGFSQEKEKLIVANLNNWAAATAASQIPAQDSIYYFKSVNESNILEPISKKMFVLHKVLFLESISVIDRIKYFQYLSENYPENIYPSSKFSYIVTDLRNYKK